MYTYCKWLIEKKIQKSYKSYVIHILQVANRKKNFEKNYKCFVVHILQVANGKKKLKKVQVLCSATYCKNYKCYVVQLNADG